MTDQPTRSYSTKFAIDEDPISENGMWLNGRKDGVDWIDVVVKDGVAYGEVSRNGSPERRAEQGNLDGDDSAAVAPTGDYDDPTAVLTGDWGPNQHVRATVFSRKPTEEYFQEVQIRVRHTMKAHDCSGYELIWRALNSHASYVEIVRWNGKIGDWTSLARRTGPEYGIEDGDLVEAIIEGNLIRGFTNGVEVISVTDDTYASGAPGMGFNFGVANTNVDHGFRSYQVDTYLP